MCEWRTGVMASTRLPAVRTQGSCPMINEARRKATGATRRNPASVNDNKAMSSISTHFPFRYRGPPLPPIPPFWKPSLRQIWKANWKDLLCGLESELEISSLENGSALVTFTQTSSLTVLLHLILTDMSQPGFARSGVTKRYFSISTSKISTFPTFPQLSPTSQVIFIVLSTAMQQWC